MVTYSKYNTSFIIIFLVVIFIIYIILSFINAKRIYKFWNKVIEKEVSSQNQNDRASKYLKSLQSAWVCQNHTARSLHLNIVLSHQEILDKINSYFKAMLECADESNSQKEEGVRYFPFVINGEINSLINNFGLNDVKKYVYNLGLYILEPNSETQWMSDISKGLYKYHYGLVVPEEGEFGINIKDLKLSSTDNNSVHRIKWKSRQGFIWDSTFEHRLVNQSKSRCLIIVADIERKLSWRNQIITSFLHNFFPPN